MNDISLRGEMDKTGQFIRHGQQERRWRSRDLWFGNWMDNRAVQTETGNTGEGPVWME